MNSDSEGTDALVASLDSNSGVMSMNRWVVNTRATRHMTVHQELLSAYCQFRKPEAVGLGDRRTVDAYGTGRVKVSMLLGRGSKCDTAMSPVL